MVSLYVGLRFPAETYSNYERFVVNNVVLSLNCDSVKIAVARKVKISTQAIELIYCGRVICDGFSLESQGIKPGVTIHAMQKMNPQTPPKRPTIPFDEKLMIVTEFSAFLSSHFQRISRPEVLQEILDEYPAFYSNLGALAFLRDPILLSSMSDIENLEKIMENYSILVEAGFFIAEVLKGAEKTKTDTTQEAGDDQLSDSSTNSDSVLPSPSTSYNNRNTPRRITRQQLGAALALAEYASRNSLSDIAQRNLDETAESTEPANPTPGPSSNSRAPTISTSMLNDVLSRISTPGAPQAAPETAAPPPAQQYAAELQRMREMGLIDDQVNLQALQVCNGDVEAAINLVFSDEL